MTPAPVRPGDEGGTSAALAVPSFVLISMSRIALPPLIQRLLNFARTLSARKMAIAQKHVIAWNFGDEASVHLPWRRHQTRSDRDEQGV
jgi:hypothetical protein